MPVTPLALHRAPTDFSDHVAYGITRFLRFFADTFFARRYGHRAVVLETVVAHDYSCVRLLASCLYKRQRGREQRAGLAGPRTLRARL